MSLIEVHSRLANTALYYTIAMAIWGLFRYFRKQGVDSNFWGGLVIGEILYLAQGALGAYLLVSGRGVLTGPFMHILYGVVAVLTPPALFMWTRGDEGRRVMLVYGVGFLFLVGILFRSMATGV
jgi:hypothetical protein